MPRQANAYFSSSDAAFPDRYAASRRFGAIRSGHVGVKGGWRVYSSGPGLFINRLVCNVLGLREAFDTVLFDPVLPRRLDGLTFHADYAGRPVAYRYRITGSGFGPGEVRVNGRAIEARRAANPYRTGGLLVSRTAFVDALDRDESVVELRI